MTTVCGSSTSPRAGTVASGVGHRGNRRLSPRRDFRLLWASSGLDELGTAVELAIFPLLAAYVLDSSALEMSLLYACGTAAFLVIGLPAGAWVDRARRRRIMQMANLAHAVLLLTVPLATWAGLLTFVQLLIVATLTGALSVFFGVAAFAYLPALVGKADIGRYNAKIYSVQAVARLSGPALSGVLAQTIGFGNAVLVSVAGLLASSGLLARIRAREAAPVRSRSTRLVEEVWEGVRYVYKNRWLRMSLACSATFNFFRNIATAVQVLFLARTLDLSPLVVGILLSLFAAGGAIGAATAPWWVKSIGQERAMWLPLLCTQPLMALVALAERDWRLLPMSLGMVAVGYGGQVYNVAQMSLRQQVCDDNLMGRMNASCRFVAWSVVPLGALAGGALAETVGLRGALWVATVGGLGAPCWLLGASERSRDADGEITETPEVAASTE